MVVKNKLFGRYGVVVAAMIFLFSCSRTLRDQDTIYVAADIGDAISMDPAELFSRSTTRIAVNVYRRLVRDRDEKLEYDLIERAHFDPQKRVMRVTLKAGQVFASGNPVTADDVVFSFVRTVKLQKSAASIIAPLGYTPQNVDRLIRYVDERTVDFEFPCDLSEQVILSCFDGTSASIVDSELLKEHTVGGDYGNGWLRKNCAGGGPFNIVEWKPGERITLVKNERSKGYCEARCKQIVVRHVPDIATRTLFLQRGEVDVAIELPQEAMDSLDDAQYRKVKHNSGRVWYLNMNQNNEYLRNPKVQQAIRHLIDYKGLAEVLAGSLAKPLPTLIPRGYEGYMESRNVPEYSPQKAKKLVHEAYGRDIELDIDVYVLGAGQALKAAFAEGGIKLKINYCDNKQAIGKIRARTHVLCLKHFCADRPDALAFVTAFVARPGIVSWRNHLDNVELYKIVDDLMIVSDACARQKLFTELQEKFLKKPLIMIAEVSDSTVSAKTVKGVGDAIELCGLQFYTWERI